jgi:hypothetical protein
MLVEQMSTARVYTDPFNFYTHDKFFSDEIYQNIINNMPAQELYAPLYHLDSTDDYGSKRYEFVFTKENISKLTIEQKEIWCPLVEELSSKEFRDVAFERLKYDLIARHGSLNIQSKSKVLLYRDFSGYKITPHTDKHTKIATIQFYLPHDNSYENYGTCMYKKIGSRQYETVHKMKFLPRHGYGFAVTEEKSWHGVEEIKEPNVVRNSLMVIYFKN